MGIWIRFVRLAVILAAAGAAPACTLIGFSIGAAHDSGINSQQRREPIPAGGIETVQTGRTLIVHLRNGSNVSGKYRGLQPVPSDEYARRYAAARQGASTGSLPELGPGTILTTPAGSKVAGDLLGLDPGALWILLEGRDSPTRVRLEQVRSMEDGGGSSFQGEALGRLAATGSVPVRSRLLLQNQEGRAQIPLEDVAQIDLVLKTSNGRRKGLLIEAACDVALLTTVVIACGDCY